MTAKGLASGLSLTVAVLSRRLSRFSMSIMYVWITLLKPGGGAWGELNAQQSGESNSLMAPMGLPNQQSTKTTCLAAYLSSTMLAELTCTCSV